MTIKSPTGGTGAHGSYGAQVATISTIVARLLSAASAADRKAPPGRGDFRWDLGGIHRIFVGMFKGIDMDLVSWSL